MPEGDVVWQTARRLDEALAGRVLTRSDFRVPRHATADLTGQTVTESVGRTGRLVVVEENQYTGGWGTEIAAHVAGACFDALHAPVLRITAPDVPVPFGQELERRFVPSAEYVSEQVGSLIETRRVPAPWWEAFA